jgi:hypothetical protein
MVVGQTASTVEGLEGLVSKPSYHETDVVNDCVHVIGVTCSEHRWAIG